MLQKAVELRDLSQVHSTRDLLMEFISSSVSLNIQERDDLEWVVQEVTSNAVRYKKAKTLANIEVLLPDCKARKFIIVSKNDIPAKKIALIKSRKIKRVRNRILVALNGDEELLYKKDSYGFGIDLVKKLNFRITHTLVLRKRSSYLETIAKQPLKPADF